MTDGREENSLLFESAQQWQWQRREYEGNVRVIYMEWNEMEWSGIQKWVRYAEKKWKENKKNDKKSNE